MNFMSITVPVETLNVMLLTSSEHYNVSGDDIAHTIANLILIETLVKLACGPIIGVFIDKIGRRNTALIGYIIESLSTYFMGNFK